MLNIVSGKIQYGVSYIVYGTQSVIYNGIIYITGQIFRGILSTSLYMFSGSGTQLVYEVLEIDGAGVVFEENALDLPVFLDKTNSTGLALEYQQNAKDIIFEDITIFNGFAIELLDYPVYSFTITEKRL